MGFQQLVERLLFAQFERKLAHTHTLNAGKKAIIMTSQGKTILHKWKFFFLGFFIQIFFFSYSSFCNATRRSHRDGKILKNFQDEEKKKITENETIIIVVQFEDDFLNLSFLTVEYTNK